MASRMEKVPQNVPTNKKEKINLNRKILNKNDEAYELTSHIFDPCRSSPPNNWNTRLKNGIWVPTFPNAQYLCGRLEYDFWLKNYKAFDKHGAFADSILPIVEKGKMQLVDHGWELSDGLTVELGPGHTPGHLCLNAKEGAVFCGDVVHSPLQLKFPELSSAFCSNSKAASKTRKKLLRRISETHDFLIPAHFPDPGWVKIKKVKVGYETDR